MKPMHQAYDFTSALSIFSIVQNTDLSEALLEPNGRLPAILPLGI